MLTKIKENLEYYYVQVIDFPSEIGYFFRRVKRLIEFFPVIWSTYDFDSSMQYEFLRYTTQRFLKYVETKGHCVRTKRFDRDVKTIIYLLGRVNNDFGHNNDKHEEYLYKRYNIAKSEFKFVAIKDTDLLRWHNLYLTHNGDILSGEKLEAFRKEQSKMFHASRKQQQTEHKMLFDLLNKRLPHMWD